MTLSQERLYSQRARARDGAYAMHEAIWTLHLRLLRNDVPPREESLIPNPKIVPPLHCGNLVFVAFAKTFLPRGFIETENLACSLSLLPLLQFPEKRAYCSKIKPIVVVTFGWRGPIVLSVPRLSITGIPSVVD